jgi:hypothetical protein
MRFIRDSSMMTAPSATAPPDSPVPAPRGTNGIVAMCSAETTLWISSVL